MTDRRITDYGFNSPIPESQANIFLSLGRIQILLGNLREVCGDKVNPLADEFFKLQEALLRDSRPKGPVLRGT